MMRVRRQPARPPRPDALRIAELEYELFGIEPPPGSAAAFVIGLRQAVGGLSTDTIITVPETMSRYDAAEFAAQYASRAPDEHSAVLVHGPDRWDLSPGRR